MKLIATRAYGAAWLFALLMMICPLSGGAVTSVYGTAILKSADGGMIALKESASDEAATIASYYQGVKVVNNTDPYREWVNVLIGKQQGYVKSANLHRWDDPGEVLPLMPVMEVHNGTPEAWLNLRELPSQDARVLGKYDDGRFVTIMGLHGGKEWAHVQTDDGKEGYMMTSYMWNHSPFTQTYVSERVYASRQRMERGIHAKVELLEHFGEGGFFTAVMLEFDQGYTTVDDIAAFKLYINDSAAFLLKPQNQTPEAALVLFATFIEYQGAIDRVTVVPVLERGGENPVETLVVYQR